MKFRKKIKDIGVVKVGDTKAESALNGMLELGNSAGTGIMANIFLMRLGFNVERSKQFKDTNEQTDSALLRFPAMIPYRDKLYAKIEKHRKENGLPF